MTEPLVVEVVRHPYVESTHLVHAVVADADGTVVRAWGDADRPTAPRSAVKPLQALPLIESGAADAFGLTDVQLALACASHDGEAGHVEAVEAWLAEIGCSVDDLECGVQPDRPSTASANNCSGKHAGFLTVARHLGVDPAGYVRPDHPVQRLVTEALATTTATPLDPGAAGVDGCGIPVFAIPLRSLAVAAARFGAPGPHWEPERVDAARRLAKAMLAEPWYVTGTRGLTTDLLADGGEIVVKDGAEGVQLAALPTLGLGVALKAEDGARRAAEVALGHLLSELEGRDRDAVFGPRRRVENHAGETVGELRVRQR